MRNQFDKRDAFQAVAAVAFTTGQLCAVHSDKKAYHACAATGAAKDVPAVGVAAQDIAAGDTGTFMVRTTLAEVTGLTAPGPVYLGSGLGDMSNSAGDTSQVVGYQHADSDCVRVDLGTISVAAVHTSNS